MLGWLAVTDSNRGAYLEPLAIQFLAESRNRDIVVLRGLSPCGLLRDGTYTFEAPHRSTATHAIDYQLEEDSARR